MFIAEHFLSDIVEEYGKHPVSTDGGTWYPQACGFFNVYLILFCYYVIEPGS